MAGSKNVASQEQPKKLAWIRDRVKKLKSEKEENQPSSCLSVHYTLHCVVHDTCVCTATLCRLLADCCFGTGQTSWLVGQLGRGSTRRHVIFF